MKSRSFTVRCTPAEAATLAEALRSYADAAYPAGGSECAQVARETLRDSAALIARDAAGANGAALRRRQRVLIRAATTWFCEDRCIDELERRRLLQLLDAPEAR